MTSPNLAQELAADSLTARFAVCHHAPAGAEDRDPHARANALDAVVTDVDAAARGRHAADPVDGRLPVAPVAQDDRERLLLFALADADVVEVALGLEHARDVLLQA